uniref:Syndecan 4 n=1 Tax=Anolis carolinensis TaxID=28377 RepID=A0A803TYM7_ANOCA
MDPQLYAGEFSSGDLPDDEDSRTDFIIDDEDESSGSGDTEGYSDTENILRSNTDSSSVIRDNYIPDSKPEIKDKIEPMRENEIIVPKKAAPPGAEDLDNEISLASTANGSILERTEVLAGNHFLIEESTCNSLKVKENMLFFLKRSLLSGRWRTENTI